MDNGARRAKMIDITGPIAPGMWHYAEPYFAPAVTLIRQPEWVKGGVHSEAVTMPLQTGTYIETAAHVDSGRERINAVSLERTTLVEAIAVQIPTGRTASIGRDALEQAVRSVREPPYEGMALLVGSGWSAHWFESDYVTDGPYFTQGVIEFVVEGGFSILGADFPRFDNPAAPTGHLRRFFETDALLLAPLYGLGRVGDAVGALIAAPLPIAHASASPVRAIWVQDW